MRIDEAFARARAELAQFSGMRPLDPPPSFRGRLRDYQRDALGWFAFLRRFGFGGCLADDMGLGKTVMVLALLEARRVSRETGAPRTSVAVVPRSLVYNWMDEAARFAPELRVLDYTGDARAIGAGRGLRPGADHLRHAAPGRGAAGRARVRLRDPRRGAGHQERGDRIGEGGAAAARPSSARAERHADREPSRRAVEPVRVPQSRASSDRRRRSAGAVAGRTRRAARPRAARPRAAAVHPAAHEGAGRAGAAGEGRADDSLRARAPQRRFYDELRRHYRQTLLAAVAKKGLARSKMQVLEALLRLRQAASHAGLVDPARGGEPPRSSRSCCRAARDRRRRAQGAGVLPVHDAARPAARAQARRADHLRVSGRPDPRSRRTGRAVRRRTATVRCS